MTLAFSTHINGKPTYFVEKIINSLTADNFERLTAINIQNGQFQSPHYRNTPNNFPAKIHTIRKDEKDRWKKGKKIHPVLFNRTSKRFQFAPELKVISIQKISIVYDGPVHGVYIDDELLLNGQLLELAKNDGFESVSDFIAYFSEDFEGKIIHWTDFKYQP